MASVAVVVAASAWWPCGSPLLPRRYHADRERPQGPRTARDAPQWSPDGLGFSCSALGFSLALAIMHWSK